MKSAPAPFDVDAVVRRKVERSVTTAAHVNIVDDWSFVSSFGDTKAIAAQTKSSTRAVYAEGERAANITVLGGSGLLGGGIVRACRSNPLVNSVTVVVRDVEKAEKVLRPLFDQEAELKEREQKGYRQLKKSSLTATNHVAKLRIVQGDVRYRDSGDATVGSVDDDSGLQEAIAQSDVVFNCTAGTVERGNRPWDVDYCGAVRVAHLAAQCDAVYVGFSSIYNRKKSSWFWWWGYQMSKVRPKLHQSQRQMERVFLNDSGVVQLEKPSPEKGPRGVFKWRWRWQVPSEMQSLTFPGDFRFSIFRLAELLPARMSSSYEMLHNDSLEHNFNFSPWPLASTMAGLVLLRAVLCHTGQWQHRIDIAGRSSQEEGIPTQTRMDCDLSRAVVGY